MNDTKKKKLSDYIKKLGIDNFEAVAEQIVFWNDAKVKIELLNDSFSTLDFTPLETPIEETN